MDDTTDLAGVKSVLAEVKTALERNTEALIANNLRQATSDAEIKTILERGCTPGVEMCHEANEYTRAEVSKAHDFTMTEVTKVHERIDRQNYWQWLIGAVATAVASVGTWFAVKP